MKKRICTLFLLLTACMIALLPVLTSCGSDASADRNAITSVALTEKGNLVIEGELTKGFLAGYEGERIYLFELPSAFSTAADLRELMPVANAKPRETVSFTVPLTDGARTRLFSSFLLASYDAEKGIYAPLTTPVAVSGADKLASRPTDEKNPETSIKGLISPEVGDALSLGISHTLLDVDMAELILRDWQEGAVSYVYGGTTAYLDGEVLAALDESVKAYTRNGVNVYLRFILKAPKDTTPRELYAVKNPEEATCTYFAVRMEDVTAARIMEGFFDFMADRYADSEEGQVPVSAFVVGYRVNDPAAYNGTDQAMLSSYVTSYEKLTRVAHTALKSHNPHGRVYISLDSHRSARTMKEGWDVLTFLSAFRDECALRGDYDWQVAAELTAPTPEVWQENAVVDTDFYTLHSLSTLTDVLSGESYATPDGRRRTLVITGFSIPACGADGVITEDTLKSQAASYAYAYMTCLHNGRVEALLYSAYADTLELDGRRGLRGVALEEDGDVILQEKRPICHVFKLVDTTKASTLSEDLTATVGSPFIKLEASLAGRLSPITLLGGEGKLDGFESVHKNATPLFTFDGGEDHGFAGCGGVVYTALKATETLPHQQAYLYTRLDRVHRGDPGGISVVVSAKSLMEAKKILLDLYAGSVSGEGDEDASVTLRLIRPAVGAVSDGDGALLYESTVTGISGDHWQTASFDVSALTAILEEEDSVILAVSVNNPHTDAYELGLAGVYVTDSTAEPPMPVGMVVTVVIILVLLVVGVFLLIFLRNKDKKQEE